MVLVEYESYGESGDEEGGDENAGTVELFSVARPTEVVHSDVNNSGEDYNVLFTKLPQPKKINNTIEEVQDEYLNKKEIPVEKPELKAKIKIAVPSLRSYESDEDESRQVPRKKICSKSSGLLAALPPPKGATLSNKSFIPNIVKRKAAQKPNTKSQNEPPHTYSDSDDDNIEIFDGDAWEKACAPKKRAIKKTVEVIAQAAPPTCSSFVHIAPEPHKPYQGLDNAAFKELVGSLKRRKENIKLVDVSEDEVLPETDQWLLKSITDPMIQPQTVVEDPVNQTCRRKHHITYLAEMAKANEQELQNQWSHNKYNRMLTRSKYGF